MTKDEFLRFIKRIRENEYVVIDTYLTNGMTGKLFDNTDWLCDLVSGLRKTESDLEGYLFIGKNIHSCGQNCNQKLFPDIYYYEDLYEHLLTLRYSEDFAHLYAKIVAGGGYKAFTKQYTKDSWLKGDLHTFCLSCKCLPRRTKFTDLLYTEYDLFQRGK